MLDPGVELLFFFKPARDLLRFAAIAVASNLHAINGGRPRGRIEHERRIALTSEPTRDRAGRRAILERVHLHDPLAATSG